jgi:hypothetical protein
METKKRTVFSRCGLEMPEIGIVEGAAYVLVLEDPCATKISGWLRVCNNKLEHMAARAERLPATWRGDAGHNASVPDIVSVRVI